VDLAEPQEGPDRVARGRLGDAHVQGRVRWYEPLVGGIPEAGPEDAEGMDRDLARHLPARRAMDHAPPFPAPDRHRVERLLVEQVPRPHRDVAAFDSVERHPGEGRLDDVDAPHRALPVDAPHPALELAPLEPRLAVAEEGLPARIADLFE